MPITARAFPGGDDASVQKRGWARERQCGLNSHPAFGHEFQYLTKRSAGVGAPTLPGINCSEVRDPGPH